MLALFVRTERELNSRRDFTPSEIHQEKFDFSFRERNSFPGDESIPAFELTARVWLAHSRAHSNSTHKDYFARVNCLMLNGIVLIQS